MSRTCGRTEWADGPAVPQGEQHAPGRGAQVWVLFLGCRQGMCCLPRARGVGRGAVWDEMGEMWKGLAHRWGQQGAAPAWPGSALLPFGTWGAAPTHGPAVLWCWMPEPWLHPGAGRALYVHCTSCMPHCLCSTSHCTHAARPAVHVVGAVSHRCAQPAAHSAARLHTQHTPWLVRQLVQPFLLATTPTTSTQQPLQQEAAKRPLPPPALPVLQATKLIREI